MFATSPTFVSALYDKKEFKSRGGSVGHAGGLGGHEGVGGVSQLQVVNGDGDWVDGFTEGSSSTIIGAAFIGIIFTTGIGGERIGARDGLLSKILGWTCCIKNISLQQSKSRNARKRNFNK